MIEIIAHRGMWLHPEEKNTLPAFKRALEHGFGIETDFRDRNGELVISHDLPTKTSLKAEIFFDLCSQYENTSPHAINIKADGLQALLATYLGNWHFGRYFIFDMSIPDLLGYLRVGLNTFSRISEYEAHQDFGGKTNGIWLDAFDNEWYSPEALQKLLLLKKSIAIVSPELHGRSHNSLWAMIKSINRLDSSFMLCTDLPLEAREYFDEKD